MATFYSQFRLQPHAKNTIRCCHGTACHVSGATRISEEVEKHLGIQAGENTADMLYTIEEVHCVGACGMAPVVMINDRAHGKLTPEKAVEVVKAFRAEIEGDGAGRRSAAEATERRLMASDEPLERTLSSPLRRTLGSPSPRSTSASVWVPAAWPPAAARC